MPDDAALDRCYRVRQLAYRWRVAPARVRAMIRTGQLPAIQIGGQVRVTPEAIRELERGTLSVRPKVRRTRQRISAEVVAMLEA